MCVFHQNLAFITPRDSHGARSIHAYKASGYRRQDGATAQYIQYPAGVAWDLDGGFYFISGVRVLHTNRNGLIDSIIGGRTGGIATGDGALATSSAVNLVWPNALAVDSAGNLYIGDRFAPLVRRVDALTGIITSFAGKYAVSLVVDGSLATAGSLSSMNGLAVDGSGNLYIADSNRVRKVTAKTGVITTVAGGGTASPANGILATNALFYDDISSVAVDSTGNLYFTYIADSNVYKVSQAGGILTILATIPQATSESRLGVDAAGNVYVNNSNGIFMISPTGSRLNLTARGPSFYTGEGGPASAAYLPGRGFIAVDASGNILYSDQEDWLILKIDGATKTIRTVAGTRAAPGDNGPASSAMLGQPTGLAVDSAGNLYIGDWGGARIRKISASTGIISTVAGNGIKALQSDGGPAINSVIAYYASQSNFPVAVDAQGNVYFGETDRIRKIAAQSGILTTVAGGGIKTSDSDGGLATAADLRSVTDLIVNGSNLYFTQWFPSGTRAIRSVDLTTGILQTLFNEGMALDRDKTGNLFFLDRTGSTLQELPAGASISSTIAGCPSIPSPCTTYGVHTGAQLGDGGPAQKAFLNSASNLRVNQSGDLFIADGGDYRIRSISAATGLINTIAGGVAPGDCSAAGGPATSNRLAGGSTVLALDAAGAVYFSDCQSIFKLTPSATSYTGNLDTPTCQIISGWAADRDRPSQSIAISVYDGTTLLTTITANLARSDAASAVGDNGLHGFTYTVPAGLRDGSAHNIRVVYETTTLELPGSPKNFSCGASTAPLAGGVSPAGGSGLTQMFKFNFSSPGGYQSINLIDVLINNFLDGRKACYVAVVPAGATATVYLVNDTGDAGGPYATMTVPGTSTVQNNQCTINGASLISATGNSLTVTLFITFKAAFAGNKIVYTAAQTAAGNTGWQAAGSWNVQSSTVVPGPSVGGATPSHGTTANGAYDFTFTDSNGFEDLTVANILINSFLDGRHACYIAYVPATATNGTLYLVNDAGDAAGPYTSMQLPGSGTVQNSQCVIHGAGSSPYGFANTLALRLNIDFTNFSGNRVMYLAARSNALSSDWQAVGSVAVP